MKNHVQSHGDYIKACGPPSFRIFNENDCRFDVSDDSAFAYILQQEDNEKMVAKLQQERIDADMALKFQESLNEIEYECVACMDLYKVSAMYTTDCPQSHR